jgi:alpha-N-arabinofuranosidase
MLKHRPTQLIASLFLIFASNLSVKAQTIDAPKAVTDKPIVLTIDAGKVVSHVSPTLYGIMTEEINHSYDGGLYAELIQNRIFKDDAKTPAHWSLIQKEDNSGSISLDNSQAINDSLTVCLKLEADKASKNNPVGIANDGYWGIPIKPKTVYHASFYAKSKGVFAGALTVNLESNDGKVFAQAQVVHLKQGWQKYSVTLTTGAGVVPSVNNKLVITTQNPGTIWFNLVSLFPPTYNNTKNGNRIDIMQKLADLHPTFLRCPGGNYVEGSTMATYYNWKKTIHDVSLRPGHPGTWKYRSSDGMGILEYMEWCEDLHIQPVLAIFAGYTLNREYVAAGPALQKYVNDALDEIEYITGDAKTTWGAQRVADGHPKAFPLTYVEIGNEDFFDRSGSYDGRFAQFYDAIKAKYPKLQLIATTKVTLRKPDVLDEHFYRKPQDFEKDTHHYDEYSRSGPKVFVGEWASRTNEPEPTPNMSCALGDAAWMTGMERNTDLIVMASYAPLFVNVNPGAWQWRINMIGYDALNSYGSPSYYAQQMFYQNVGNVVLSSNISNIPEVPYTPTPPKVAAGATPPPPPAPSTMPSLSYSVTRNSQTGVVYLKVVNILGNPQSVNIDLKGVAGVEPNGTAITLSGKPEDTNSITDPVKLIPVITKTSGLNSNFNYIFTPYSVTVLQIKTK